MNILDKIWRFVKNIITIHRFRLLIFFVTNRCNAKCKICFYWRNLNKAIKELNIEEIDSVSSNLPRFDTLQISGGEPFLRDGLDKICEIFYKNNRVRFINIPTNCLLSEKISVLTEKILQSCPEAIITICCALDGIGDTHDHIRGVKGNFEKFKITINLLKKLEKKYPNLLVSALTTLSKDNYEEYNRINKFVEEELKVEHSIDVARHGMSENKEIEDVPIDAIKKIHRVRLNDIYFNTKHRIVKRIIQAGTTIIFSKIYENAREYKKWPLRCSAGENAVVLEPNGDVRLCEHRDVVGNVRENDYKIFSIINNEETINTRKEIIKSHCSCDNGVFIYMSINNSRYYKIMELIEGLISSLWLR